MPTPSTVPKPSLHNCNLAHLVLLTEPLGLILHFFWTYSVLARAAITDDTYGHAYIQIWFESPCPSQLLNIMESCKWFRKLEFKGYEAQHPILEISVQIKEPIEAFRLNG